MGLRQGKESARKSDAISDRRRRQMVSGQLLDWGSRAGRAAHRWERERALTTEDGNDGPVHEGAAAPDHLPHGNVASDTSGVGSDSGGQAPGGGVARSRDR